MSDAKILIYDLETAPNLGYVWQTWKTNVINNGGLQKQWYILSAAYKWLGEDETHVMSLPDFPRYKRDRTDDTALTTKLRDLFNEADVTVTHNGRSFDNPKALTRMVINGVEPPSPYREVDTYQIARRQFAFASNRLGDLAEFMGIKAKGDPGGFKTWLGAMAGDPEAWKQMTEYNKQDVVVLEELFFKFLPWIPNLPNMAILTDRPNACPRCGAEGTLQKRGFKNYVATRRQIYQCQSCKGYVGDRKTERLPNRYVSI